jgi:hypothetical protein
MGRRTNDDDDDFWVLVSIFLALATLRFFFEGDRNLLFSHSNKFEPSRPGDWR